MRRLTLFLIILVSIFSACSGCEDSTGGGACSVDEDCATGETCIDGLCLRDADGDRVPDDIDNCIDDPNDDQTDTDGNGIGDECENNQNTNNTNNANNVIDTDGDGIPDDEDNCPMISNPNQSDIDGDGIGDICDDDRDGDTIINTMDNCPDVANLDQADVDQDGIGDACDPDTIRRTGRPFDPGCAYAATPGVFAPTLEWSQGVGQNDPYADRDQVMMTPVVANLTDDNGDGVIDMTDIPDVIYTSFATNNDQGNWDQLQYGVLRAVSGDGSGAHWSVGFTELGLGATGGVQPAGSVAVGDIDDDGFVEIVTGIWDNATETGGLVVINHDGTVAFTTSYEINGVQQPRQFKYWWGGPSIADLDSDGDVEIVIGNVVFDHMGNLVWDGNDNINLTGPAGEGVNWASGLPANNLYSGTLSLVADLTDDGNAAQHVVTGRTVYTAAGDLLWEADVALPDGFPAIGDFNNDGAPEVVVSANGTVRIHSNIDGTVIWGPVTIEDSNGARSGRVGAPTVADFDGDGVPEIGVAARDQYVALKVDLGTPNPTYDQAALWEMPTQDNSSNMTGSSVFDFEGDGKAEVVYNDELFLRVYDGTTGNVLFEQANTSFTALEYPIIVDVDNDGAAEIVVGTNDFECDDQLTCAKGFSGIKVYGDNDDNWVATRRIWNQHTYHITNVEEAGGIPQTEVASWVNHNTYRLNAQTSIDPQAAPDLIGEDLSITPDACDVIVNVWVTNSGAERVGAGLPVNMYAVMGQTRTLIGSGMTQFALEPGESEKVAMLGVLPVGGPWIVEVVVDEDMNGMSTKNECKEDNNTVSGSNGITCNP